MRPVSFQWTLAERPNDRSRQVGFIAEEMVGVVPEVVEMNASGTPEGIDYDKLTSILARAVQQIASITGTFKANLIAWLADAQNGIQHFFASRVFTQELCVTDSPGDQSPVCITKTQLAALLSQSAPAPLANPSPPEAPAVHESATSSDTTVHEFANPMHESATSSPPANTLLIEQPPSSSEPTEPEAVPPNPANDNSPPPSEPANDNPASPSAEAI